MEFLASLRRLEEDAENFEDFEHLPVHAELEKRFRNTLYLGKGVEGISLPVADVAVDLFQNAAEKNLGTFTRRHVAKFNRNGQVNPSSSVLGMMYARRLKQRKSDYLNKVTSTELFLVSMMLATKFLYDEGEDEEIFSDEWAESANLDVKRVNELEREFLEAIDWDLYIEPDEFYEFLHQMETWIALNEGHRRGWFSYSDMNVLMEHADWYSTLSSLLEQSVKVLGLCVAMYSLCSATLCWSLLVLQHHSSIPGMSLDGGNHSHVYGGMRPIKGTQVATHQSEILLPPRDVPSEAGSILTEHLPALETLTPCPSCRECSRSAGEGFLAWQTPHCAEEHRLSVGTDMNGFATCGQCLTRHKPEDYWLRNQIDRARRAMVSFYHALLVAYYDTDTESLATRNALRNPIQNHSCHRANGSQSHQEPSVVYDTSFEVRCPRLAQSDEESETPLDSNADVFSGVADSSRHQCSLCDGARNPGLFHKTIHMVLRTSLDDSAVGSTTGTLPIIVA
ncbi:protein CNPPD1-like [Diadema antillarum]|uniref:protein CNPPD1-like n=1 Tax=Diadema antillarum TaxID=105358 RepID=UPI003A8488E4